MLRIVCLRFGMRKWQAISAALRLSRTLLRARLTSRPMKGRVFVRPAGRETAAQLRHWLALALDFNPRAKASRKRRAG
jgi:hypothetical protein